MNFWEIIYVKKCNYILLQIVINSQKQQNYISSESTVKYYRCILRIHKKIINLRHPDEI